MRRFRKLICSLFGHNYFKLFTKDNGSSIYGEFQCNRCGNRDEFQYDYN
jgi:hypothetical protein